jgi:hypothetical protein
MPRPRTRDQGLLTTGGAHCSQCAGLDQSYSPSPRTIRSRPASRVNGEAWPLHEFPSSLDMTPTQLTALTHAMAGLSKVLFGLEINMEHSVIQGARTN